MLNAQMMQAVSAVAKERGIDKAALAAVVHVESGGRAHVAVDGRREPVIRFEGHYFDRRLSGEKLERARKEGLASPTAGKIANPPSQSGRWKLLDRAVALDKQAAFESVSWGVGQVMGAHWLWLGYGSVDALVAEARAGISGQLHLMAKFIDKAGLARALNKRDWQTFARGYNGPAFGKNGHDAKLAKAYARYASADWPTGEAPQTMPPASIFDRTLRMLVRIFGK